MRKITLIIIILVIVSTLPKAMAARTMTLDRSSYSLTGKASWYSEKSPGIKKHTANNEIFKDTNMTCAMWGIRFNRKIRVTNLENGKSIIVRVNDRGPHKRYVRKGRIIDLTKSAFGKLSTNKKGLLDVKLEFL